MLPGLPRVRSQWLLDATYAFLSVAIECHPIVRCRMKNAIVEFLSACQSQKKEHGDANLFTQVW
jgi:hypothetical protein